MKVSEFKIFLLGSAVVFFGGFGLQVSLFHQISRQQRNTTALNNVSLKTALLQPPPPRPLIPPQKIAPINYGRCAINLYGLPRAFESLVLPSLVKNVIQGE